ncbi:MAG TPA: endonuclease/exonuclease/phosphatase family protein [Geminicoccaceae bacterium]|nr:endonuclease/exonuclease/phosphatase family protein [Geminicoccus sp.]HMU49491.1 endonuclease/exonuclease/phosphatase family protein [Geminicoccaceae bacterium]
MRIATYNVENLFDRAKVMNQDSWAEGRPTLDRFAELNALLARIAYSPADKVRMAELMVELGLEKSDTGPFVLLRRNRGKLLRRPKTGGIEITADGRADWAGSLELRDEPVGEGAMRNTARAMIDLRADVLAVVEAESRPVLAAFNTEIVKALGGAPFRHVMVIDGNDERGIDVGLMSRAGFPIGVMRSHVDDRLTDGTPVFSRDCPEFSVATPSGNRLTMLVNHFKSKGYGGKAASDARRKAQSARVREICRELMQAGQDLLAVVGDLNDTPDSDPLAPLLADGELRDVFGHPAFEDGGWPGTYGLCNAGNKIDYLLLSPKLWERVTAGGVFRRAMWPGSRPRRWECYAELARPEDAGSDHAAVWADIDI